MVKHTIPRRIPLPHGWPRRVSSALLHVISMAQYAVDTAMTLAWRHVAKFVRDRIHLGARG